MIYMEQSYKFLYFIFFNSQLFKKIHLSTYFMYFKPLSGLQRAWNNYGFIYGIEGKKHRRTKILLLLSVWKFFLYTEDFWYSLGTGIYHDFIP